MRNLILCLFIALPMLANAASISITCSKPIQRADNTTLKPEEIAGYAYERGATPIGTTKGPNCGYVYQIPAGQCVMPGETFRMSATDTSGRAGLWGVSKPVPADRQPICTAPPESRAAPKAPSGITLQSKA